MFIDYSNATKAHEDQAKSMVVIIVSKSARQSLARRSRISMFYFGVKIERMAWCHEKNDA